MQPHAPHHTQYQQYPTGESIRVAEEFQDFVMQVLWQRMGFPVSVYTSRKYQWAHGESLQGVEIKFDGRCLETGRLSIEIAEKNNESVNQWTASGIYSPHQSWMYVQGNFNRLYVFATRHLLAAHQSRRDTEHEWKTVRKFYLTLQDADRLAIQFFDFRD